jgi:hypothetical protein
MTGQGLCWFIPGTAVGIPRAAYLLTLLVCVSQASLEPASGSVGALLSSQCNMAWRRFVLAGGLGCQNFASSWFFFSAKCGSSVSTRLLVYRAQLILPLDTILDLHDYILEDFYTVSPSRKKERFVYHPVY